MIRKTIAAALLAMAGAAAATAGEKVWLWTAQNMPLAQPHQIAALTSETGKPDFKADENRIPFIEWHDAPAADKQVGGCMILISGGGYGCCCDIGLLKTWREKFTALGFQCVDLVYRTPRPAGLPIHASAWADGQRAVRLVRAEAAKRGFDPEKIGTISMSAGSHLAALLATSSQTAAYEKVDATDDIACHVNFAITGAIAYGLSDGNGIPNYLEGDSPDVKLDPSFKFDAKTAPMCMLHGGMDAYSPLASTFVYRKLRAMKVPAEIHLFADRGHGFWGADGKGERAAAYDNWFGRAEEFLRQLGVLGPLAPEEELMARYASDDARASHSRENVWPEGKMPCAQAHQCVPYIEWHMPKELKTKAIQIIYSGGGYGSNDPDGFEVAPTRRYLNEKGMTVVTLKYRTPRPKGMMKHITAWQDLQRTIRIVRDRAPSLGLDPQRIGIMGSSAGGHLTLMGVTSSLRKSYNPIDRLDSIPCNVQWAVPIYPAYSLTDGAEDVNSTSGTSDSARLVPEFSFDPKTCPVVFIHGDEDCWAAMNSVKCWEQMRRMGVQSDLHILVKRNHCFQRKASPGTGSYTWMDRIWEFMNHKGFNR